MIFFFFNLGKVGLKKIEIESKTEIEPIMPYILNKHKEKQVHSIRWDQLHNRLIQVPQQVKMPLTNDLSERKCKV